MSPAGASSCVLRRIVAPASATDDGLGRAAVVRFVEAHLAEVVQQRGRLELLELVPREPERATHGDGDLGDALGVPVTHHAAELGGGTQRTDRLVVRAADQREVLVRVPRREQRDREHDRAPQAHAADALRRPSSLTAMSVALVTSARSAMRPCAETPKRPFAHHPRDLGDERAARWRRPRARRAPCRAIGGVAEGVDEPVVHEDRGHALEDALDEQRQPPLDRRRLRADQERGELGDHEDERRLPGSRPAGPARP